MALLMSTGLRNFLMSGRSLRKAFDDSVLNVYSGTAPATADLAPTGVLLLQYTKSSQTVTSGDRSTPRLYNIQITGTFGAASTIPIKISIDGADTTYTYTVVAGDTDLTGVATSVARMLNDVPGLHAIATGASAYLYVQAEINGLALTVADATGGTGTTTFTVTAVTAASRKYTLQLGAPALGVIAKNSDTWSNAAIATGTASYFRLVTSRDGGDSDSDYSDCRIQGNVSTSGAELNMAAGINLTYGVTYTCDTFSLTEPASA